MIYLTGDILHSVRVVRLLAHSAELFEVHLRQKRQHMEERLSVPAGTGRPRTVSYLAGALHTPHIGTLPPDIAVLAVVVAILLL